MTTCCNVTPQNVLVSLPMFHLASVIIINKNITLDNFVEY